MVGGGQHDGTVLIVDDDPIFVELAAAVMSSIRMDIHKASDGLQALTLLERRSFDLAIVDLDLPQIDGFRLIALARSMPTAQKMRIIVVTASRDTQDHHDALTAGAEVVQVKPLNWADLVNHVRQMPFA